MATTTTTPSTFLASLLSSINTSTPNPVTSSSPSATTQQQTNNPLSTLSPTAKNLLLTLHALYPTQFLPALDILDRRLLTRPIVPSLSTSHANLNQLYLVRSAATIPRTAESSSRFHDVLAPQVYEVRLFSWNCTCPAFTFAAFPPVNDSSGGINEEGNESEWSVEGDGLACLLRERARHVFPVCKHILACVLVERIDAFSGFVEDKEISMEEFAGWAAG